MATVLLWAVVPAAEAHTLALRTAQADTFFFVYGIAYAFDVLADPTVRCVRSGASPHAVSCSWGFSRLNPSSGTASICRGTVRVYLFGGTRLHRTIVRPRRCVPAPV
jgi:hypothetical protein